MQVNLHCGHAIALSLLLLNANLKLASAILKITKVDCRTLEPSLVNLTKCVLKPVRRDVSALSVTMQLSKPVHDLKLHIQLLRKYNTYEPFLYNGTFDICSYLKNHNNFHLLDMLNDMIKPYTNVNHTCPFEGVLFVKELVLKQEILTLPWPSADYMLKTDWYLYKKLCARIHVWATLRELEHWQKPRVK